MPGSASLIAGQGELIQYEDTSCHAVLQIDRTALAGTPTAVASAGTSRVTTAPAPMKAARPTDSPCSTVAFAPTVADSEIEQFPDTAASGKREENSPSSVSWPT